MNLIEKVDLRRAFYLQQLINEHREECMNEWYDKCKFIKEKETEMKKVERYINEIIKGKGEYSTTYHHSENSKNMDDYLHIHPYNLYRVMSEDFYFIIALIMILQIVTRKYCNICVLYTTLFVLI